MKEQFQAAKQYYITHLKSQLEPQYNGLFISIDLETGNYFLGKTLSEAIQGARRAYPDRITNTFRVGPESAIYL